MSAEGGKCQLVIGLYLFTDIPADAPSIQERPWRVMHVVCVGRLSGPGGLGYLVSRAAAGICGHHALDQGLH